MTDLKQAVVVLTGAAGGFGQELTRQLLQAGSRLILTDLDRTILDNRASRIKSEIATGEIIACIESDLSNREGCETLYHQVKALEIPIDILINNAGIGLFGRMDEVPSDKWERLMQVNLLAPMRLSSLFVADMIERNQGHIVNISSLAGWIAPAGMAHYSSSKFGDRSLVKVKSYLEPIIEQQQLNATEASYLHRLPFMVSSEQLTAAMISTTVTQKEPII